MGKFGIVKNINKKGFKFMKRYGNLYSRIYSIENLMEAHRNARRDKGFYKEVKMVDADKPYYLSIIQQMLKNENYLVKPEDYTVSVINDKGKDRELWKLPYFPHRIIQWAVMLQIEPIFEQVLTDFTCASLPNRGIHRASFLMKKYLKDVENTKYCLKMDVRHFYPNINHKILKKLLRKKFKDIKLLNLLDMIIDSHSPKGIPIGSYLSQYLANFYLSYFDHYLKEGLSIKYAIRYMDDVVVLGATKEWLHNIRKRISEYLKNELDLKLKDNWQVFPVDVRGVDFVGYRYFHDFTLLRKRSCLKFKKTMNGISRKIRNNKCITYQNFCSYNSYFGWLKWCDSFRLIQKYMKPLLPTMLLYYFHGIKEGGVNYA